MDVDISEGFINEEWDKFLQSTPCGEYQQSSMWARVKSLEGWKPIRWIISDNQEIIGGFQLLWKNTKLGKIGYISRGPAVSDQVYLSKDKILESVVQAAKLKKINALIIQPPACEGEGYPFKRFGFIPNHIMKVASATIRVDISDGIKGIEGRMNPNTRRIIRQSAKKGVKIREGNKEDIGLFFRLMEATCRRRGIHPNPPTVRSLEEVWMSFEPKGCCRLTLAEFDGKTISGLLCLPFGKIVHFWKKGSLAEYFHLHPMDALYYEALTWASRNNYERCDFEEMLDRAAAEKMVRGEYVPFESIHPRDRIHIRFGGKPQLLFESQLFVNNYIFRRLITLLGKKTAARLFKKIV